MGHTQFINTDVEALNSFVAVRGIRYSCKAYMSFRLYSGHFYTLWPLKDSTHLLLEAQNLATL